MEFEIIFVPKTNSIYFLFLLKGKEKFIKGAYQTYKTYTSYQVN